MDIMRWKINPNTNKHMNDQAEKTPTSPNQLTLINNNRLQTLRKQTTTYEPTFPMPKTTKPNKTEDTKTTKLKQQIEQHLQKILTKYPQNKQHNLFKIHYGMSLEEFEYLPIQQTATILKIHSNRNF
jgi:hypothetical protein